MQNLGGQIKSIMVLSEVAYGMQNYCYSFSCTQVSDGLYVILLY